MAKQMQISPSPVLVWLVFILFWGLDALIESVCLSSNCRILGLLWIVGQLSVVMLIMG